MAAAAAQGALTGRPAAPTKRPSALGGWDLAAGKSQCAVLVRLGVYKFKLVKTLFLGVMVMSVHNVDSPMNTICFGMMVTTYYLVLFSVLDYNIIISAGEFTRVNW